MNSAVIELASDLKRRNRRSALISLAILGAIVISSIAVVAFTFKAVAEANKQLAVSNTELTKATADLSSVERTLAEKQSALARANDEISKLESQVTALNTELETKQKALQEAISLGQHIYQLDWADLKAMFVISEGAAPVLTEIFNLRDKTHWGTANTMERGFIPKALTSDSRGIPFG